MYGPACVSEGALRASAEVAVLIPCYNEEVAIGDVVRSFRAALPEAHIHVFDNNSRDKTIEIAERAGATVHRVFLQGKGNVIQRMFADIDADLYVLVDGDNTYDAASVREMLHLQRQGNFDMVVGRRVTQDKAAYRPGHRFGNWLLTAFVGKLFGRTVIDMLSGYRVFSRRFVKSFPALSSGFEIETELTVHALELRMPTTELDTPYKERPVGSESKLSTYRDGFRILLTIIKLFRTERPLIFFGAIAVVLGIAAVSLSIPLFVTYFATGLVPRLPTAVLVVGLGLSALLSMACGLILDTVTRGRNELRRLAYLQIPSTGQSRQPRAGQRSAVGS